ncbi:alpha/beta fold hydrolase [Ramlibacter sp. G-1-2-2]|uniref:Proline iminopeptidase n=2 Tax=Ramlibacter agri TaxID=2728837 RepID=A0A848HAH3_9BURK|nr:alpha/beta fold hydrolase [Ramlibacter agri]NML44618.1 alpha/beta fold hydrolase [Ramlibacter agri]
MHVEEHGNPAGLPLLLLHGGPGSGSSPALRLGVDAERYRMLCPDQRGAGQSTPRGGIEANTLAHLLADLRLLRAHLHIERWLVAGGSWGATLALLHAVDAPEAVSGLVLRNPFLARAEDMAAFFAAAGFPLPVTVDRDAALRWWQAEQRLAGGQPGSPPDEARLVDRYRVQSHFLQNRCWLRQRTLLERCAALPAIPIVIVQGSEDAICPPAGARALAQALGERASLRMAQGAGHDPTHPALVEAMRQALTPAA